MLPSRPSKHSQPIQPVLKAQTIKPATFYTARYQFFCAGWRSWHDLKSVTAKLGRVCDSPGVLCASNTCNKAIPASECTHVSRASVHTRDRARRYKAHYRRSLHIKPRPPSPATVDPEHGEQCQQLTKQFVLTPCNMQRTTSSAIQPRASAPLLFRRNPFQLRAGRCIVSSPRVPRPGLFSFKIALEDSLSDRIISLVAICA